MTYSLELLRARRTVRVFEKREVPLDLLLRALEAATWAPSAHNSQPWRFIVIGKGETRKRLIEAMSRRFLEDLLKDGVPKDEAELIVSNSTERFMKAPLLVLFCLAKSDLETYPDEKRSKAEWIMGIQSVALADGMTTSSFTLRLLPVNSNCPSMSLILRGPSTM